MRTHINIAALLVVASALLSSCELLVSSPIHSHGPQHHFAAHESSYYRRPHLVNKVYNGCFEIPAEGGIYEFDCANDQFYIARIFDTSMLYEPFDRRYSPKTDDYIDVDDFSYSGSFYTITCNKDKHNWVIKVDPIMASPDEFSYREIWVLMWDGSDNSNIVFQFEQADSESLGYIE